MGPLMADTKIRAYRSTDIDECRSLWVTLTQRHRELYADPTIGGSDPGLFFDAYLARVGPMRIWVAEQSGKVIGFVGLIVAGDDAEVEPLVVRSGCRGKGVGLALLRRVTEQARRLNVRYLGIRPVARNREAIALFHRAGFRKLGQIEMFTALSESARRGFNRRVELFGQRFGY